MGLDPPASCRRCRARGGRGSRGVTIEELLHTYTEDGLLLEGVRYPAGSDLAIVYTHGVTSTVFRQTHVRVGRELQRAGYTVVAGNNRGTALATPLTFGRTSATTLLSRAAVGDLTSRLRSVRLPVLAIYGSEETDIGGQDDLDRMRQLVAGSFTGALIAGADHLYTGREAQAAEIIAGWIGSTVTGPPSGGRLVATKNGDNDPIADVSGT